MDRFNLTNLAIEGFRADGRKVWAGRVGQVRGGDLPENYARITIRDISKASADGPMSYCRVAVMGSGYCVELRPQGSVASAGPGAKVGVFALRLRPFDSDLWNDKDESGAYPLWRLVRLPGSSWQLAGPDRTQDVMELSHLSNSIRTSLGSCWFVSGQLIRNPEAAIWQARLSVNMAPDNFDLPAGSTVLVDLRYGTGLLTLAQPCRMPGQPEMVGRIVRLSPTEAVAARPSGPSGPAPAVPAVQAPVPPGMPGAGHVSPTGAASARVGVLRGELERQPPSQQAASALQPRRRVLLAVGEQL